MPLDFRPRRALLLFFLVAIVAVVLGTVYRKRGGTSIASKVSAKADIPSPQAVAPESSLSRETEFASAALREISQLDGTTTPARWKALHPDEESADAKGYTCPNLTKAISLTLGAQATGTAYFYPPPAPATAVMPTLNGSALIDSSCTLAMIRVETPAPDPESGHAFAEALKEELSKKYGQYESVTARQLGQIHFRGAGSWKELARWRAGDIEIISAYEAPQGVYPSAPADNVFVYAQLPIVNAIDHELCCTLKDYHYRAGENQRFHRAVVLSGLPAPLRLRMDQLYESVYAAYTPGAPGPPTSNEWRASLVSTLKEWIDAERALPPGRQAAALFAADRLMAVLEDAHADELGAEGSALRADLEKIGAKFSIPEISYAYTKNWLKQALELAPEGEVGQMAVLTFISRGNCDTSGWDSQRVIAEAESLFAKGLDETTELHLHFILGDAYSDIVALAEGADPDRGTDELKRYSDEAEDARAKALENYRAAFSVDATSETARDAWQQAWHLSAGLLPRTRYVCGDI